MMDIAKLKAAPYQSKFSRLWERYDEASHDNAEHMRDILKLTLEALETAEHHIFKAEREMLELIAQNEALVAAHVNLKLLADTYRQAYEEARARIAELEEAQSLHDEGVSMLCGQFDDLAAAMGWTSEIAMSQGVSQLEYARNLKARIAELEARTLTVKLPEAATEGGRGYRKKAIWALQEACFDAGINLETGGE